MAVASSPSRKRKTQSPLDNDDPESYGPVELSPLLRAFLEYVERSSDASEWANAQSNGPQYRVELQHAEQLLQKYPSTNAWVGGLRCRGFHQPFTLAEIRSGLESLGRAWSMEYPVDVLLAINGTGLKSHMRLEEIKVGNGFEVEGPEGNGGMGVRKQWKCCENSKKGEIEAMVVFAMDGSERATTTTVMPEGNKIVQPVYGGPKRSTDFIMFTPGSRIPTASELSEKKRQWAESIRASEAIHARVRERMASEPGSQHVSYSAYKEDEHGVPIDNLDEVAVQGKAILASPPPYEFDNSNREAYQSVVVENPTWLDICVLADAMIRRMGDFDHVSLEAITPTEEDIDGVPVYYIELGS